MASSSVSLGSNSGLQVGINYGAVYPPMPVERPETPPAPLSTCPFRRDPDFVDRGTLLDEIYQKGTAEAARIALVGLGGVGKSQLAIECCYRIRERSPNTWVFWIHSANAARFEESCREIVNRVRIPGRNNPSANVLQLMHDWLVDERKGTWVVILDNLDDSRFLLEVPTGGSRRSLLAYLPISCNGSIIVTSRSKDAIYSIVEENDITAIGPMDATDAVKLFEKKLGRQAQNVHQLVTELDFIPLAMVQAAAHIKRRAPRLSVSQYLEQFTISDQKRISLLAHDGGQLRRDREAKNAILVTWQISFDHIQQFHSTTANLLSLMSQFDRQGIPESLLRHRGNNAEDDFEDNLSILSDYSLITTGVDGTTFEMHRLVQLAMREWLETHGQLESWKRCFVNILYHEFPSGEVDTWAVCEPIFSHVVYAATQPSPTQKRALKRWARVLEWAANFAFQKGHYTQSESLYHLAYDINLKLFGPHFESTNWNLDMVGMVIGLQGRPRDAELIYRQVLENRQQAFGAEDPSTLRTMSSIALSWMDQGRPKDAEELGLHVLDINNRAFGPNHLETSNGMFTLALVYEYQGRYSEAEGLRQQILEIRKRALGPEHSFTLSSMKWLASTYRHQNRRTEAKELEIQVLELRKRILGSEHLETLESMDHVIHAYLDEHRWDEAMGLNLQAIEVYSRILGPEHPDTMKSMDSLTIIYWAQGRRVDAETLALQLLESRKRSLGQEHLVTAMNMGRIAGWYWAQGRRAEAEGLVVSVLKTCKRFLRPEHPWTLSNMEQLAWWYFQQDRDDEAESLQIEVLEIRKRVLGPEDPLTLKSIGDLAFYSWHQGHRDEAKERVAQVLDTRKRVLGPEHPDTLHSMYNRAVMLWFANQDSAARLLMSECVEISNRVLGSDSFYTQLVICVSIEWLALSTPESDWNWDSTRFLL